MRYAEAARGLWARGRPRLFRAGRLQEAEPSANDTKDMTSVKPVVAASPLPPHLHDAGSLKNVQVLRRGRPTVLESRGEITRRQLASRMTQQ
jgi:hypothetical protein